MYPKYAVLLRFFFSQSVIRALNWFNWCYRWTQVIVSPTIRVAPITYQSWGAFSWNTRSKLSKAPVLRFASCSKLSQPKTPLPWKEKWDHTRSQFAHKMYKASSRGLQQNTRSYQFWYGSGVWLWLLPSSCIQSSVLCEASLNYTGRVGRRSRYRDLITISMQVYKKSQSLMEYL